MFNFSFYKVKMRVLIVFIILFAITFYLIYRDINKNNNRFRLDNFVEDFVNNRNFNQEEKFFNFFKKQKDDDPRTNNIKITYNNQQWIVQQADSAKMLNELVTRINTLIDNIKANPDKTYSLKRLKHWDSSFVFENIRESWKNDSTSYSINKGEELVFCIRDKINNSIHDINTLMFVAIHELAHIITDELQHTDKFWKNMKSLLQRAKDMGLYRYVNYNIDPVEYCGMTIDSTPEID